MALRVNGENLFYPRFINSKPRKNHTAPHYSLFPNGIGEGGTFTTTHWIWRWTKDKPPRREYLQISEEIDYIPAGEKRRRTPFGRIEGY